MADIDTAETPTTEATADTSAIDTATEAAKAFLDKAQEAIGSAFDSTLEAVKEKPLAAAGIAAGAAAAVAGAAFGISKLLEDDKPASKGKTPAKK